MRNSIQLIEILLVFILILLVNSCGGSSGEGDGPGENAIPTMEREVRLGNMKITAVDVDRWGCDGLFDISNSASFNIFVNVPNSTIARRSIITRLTSDVSITKANNRGRAHVSVGDNVCIQSEANTQGNYPNIALDFPMKEVCLPIKEDSSQLLFQLVMPASNNSCQVTLDIPALIDTYDPEIFCESSCASNLNCGRTVIGCVSSCLQNVRNAPLEANPSCHDATRDEISCQNALPCAVSNVDPIAYCEPVLGKLADAFGADCPIPEPLAAIQADPDPALCTPTQGDLVSGTLGDFAIVSRSDTASEYNLILDLTKLAEFDDVLAANPNDPALALAASVVPTLHSLNQGSRDNCADPNILSIQFDTFGASPPNFNLIHNQLTNLQTRLDSFAGLLPDLKKQATELIFKDIFCPASAQLVGGGLKGVAFQLVLGCFS